MLSIEPIKDELVQHSQSHLILNNIVSDRMSIQARPQPFADMDCDILDFLPTLLIPGHQYPIGFCKFLSTEKGENDIYDI